MCLIGKTPSTLNTLFLCSIFFLLLDSLLISLFCPSHLIYIISSSSHLSLSFLSSFSESSYFSLSLSLPLGPPSLSSLHPFLPSLSFPLDTSISDIEQAFRNFLSRPDIVIILINQNVSYHQFYHNFVQRTVLEKFIFPVTTIYYSRGTKSISRCLNLGENHSYENFTDLSLISH